MESYTNKSSMKAWAEEDQPREKLLNWGRKSLSDAELLSIILNSGDSKLSALDLAKEMLASVDYNLNTFSKMDINVLTGFSGVGHVKAVRICAALEFGKRVEYSNAEKKVQIKSSHDAYQYLRPLLEDLHFEEFWVIYLNRSNRILKHVRISSGGVSGTVVDQKLIFKKALELLASSLILLHNHPSGNLKPSQADINLTSKIVKAAEFLEIKVLDHIIISEEGYLSFADESYL